VIGLDLLSKDVGGVFFLVTSINININISGVFASSCSGLGLCYVRCYKHAHRDGGLSLKDLSNQISSTLCS